MGSEWHYVRDDQQHGPISSAQLQQLGSSGELRGSDLVWKEGLAEWTPASGIDFLAKAIAGRVLPPPIVPAHPQAVSLFPTNGPLPPPVSVPSPPTNDGKAVGKEALQAMGLLGSKMKALGQEATARVKKANASVPNQIKIGKFSVPKLTVYGAVGLVVIMLGWLLFGGNPNLTANRLQAAYAGIKGDKSGPYDEKFIKVTGKVANTRYYDPSNSVAPDRTHLALQTETDSEVMCIFRGRISGTTDLNRLSRGDEVSLKGKCTGRNMIGGVVIEDCELVSGPDSK